MAFKMSVAVRNGMLDSIETTVGTDAVLKIRSGACPAAITDADAGDVLATITLPTDWMNAANAGAKTLKGTWTDATADDTGTAEHFRVYASDGTTQHMQGSVTLTGDGGDMTVDNTSFVAGQSFTIGTFTLTAGNG